MKKLVLILVCAFASFAFASSSSLEENNSANIVGACDGYGGTVTVSIKADCDGDGVIDINETATTCADQQEAWYNTALSLCGWE